MRVLVVSGIWPPDVGGPASHAPAFASHLLVRGHQVEVVTTASTPPAPEEYPVHWVSRRLPAGVRHAAAAAAIARRARHADVVYATSMVRRAAAGSTLSRTPLVVKLVADEAYERAARSGRFSGTLEEFQEAPAGTRVRWLQATRTRALRRARVIVCPSAYLRDVAVGWGLPPARFVVVPNAAPPLPSLPSRSEARAALGLDPDEPVLGFAGRLTRQKALDVSLRALGEVPRASLVLLGEGPERERLEALRDELGLSDRARFLGGGTRDDVLRLYRAADAALLSSAWENFPHTVVETLAVGTPVVATRVGGVPEIVQDGANGLLVPPGDVEALAAALARMLSDEGLRERLAAAAAPSVQELAPERVHERLEAVLAEAAGG